MFEDSKLKVFKAVVLRKNFSKAAKDLGITQPAVSQNIAELEKNLGFQLFDRQKGQAVLTRKGQVFDSYADNILYWYSLTEEVLCSREPLPEHISIAASAGVPAAELTSLIALIRKVSPLTKVIVCPSGANDADLTISSSVTSCNGDLPAASANGGFPFVSAERDFHDASVERGFPAASTDGCFLAGAGSDSVIGNSHVCGSGYGGHAGHEESGTMDFFGDGLHAGHTESFVRQTHLTASGTFAGTALCRLIMEKARSFTCGYTI